MLITTLHNVGGKTLFNLFASILHEHDDFNACNWGDITAGKFACVCTSFACMDDAFAPRCLRGSKQYFIQFLSFQTRKSSIFA